MQYVHVHRGNAQRSSYIGPFNTDVWTEYICIMGFHTLVSCMNLVLVFGVEMAGVVRLDEEYVEMLYHGKCWHKIHFCHQTSVENVMSRVSKGLLSNNAFLPPHLGNTVIM